MKATFWVSQQTYRWASKRWSKHDVRISNYLPNETLLITKVRPLSMKPRNRRITISKELADTEMANWKENYRIGRALKKWMGK